MYAIQIPFIVSSRVFYRFIIAMRRTDLALAKFEEQSQEALGKIGQGADKKKAEQDAQRRVAKAKRELREDFSTTVLETQDDSRQDRIQPLRVFTGTKRLIYVVLKGEPSTRYSAFARTFPCSTSTESSTNPSLLRPLEFSSTRMANSSMWETTCKTPFRGSALMLAVAP